MDHADQIRICHLLGHSSGLPHFHPDEYGIFNRKSEEPSDGQTFFDVMSADPSRFWEPAETTEWAKRHLSPHFASGDGIHYSEVGYDLLGLIIEQVTSRPYHEALHDYLFDPLDMSHSYLSQFSEPAAQHNLPVAESYIDDEAYDPDTYRSFLAWYAVVEPSTRRRISSPSIERWSRASWLVRTPSGKCSNGRNYTWG